MYGTLQTHEGAVEYLAAIERGELTSAINPYMIQEALGASTGRIASLRPNEMLPRRRF